MPSGGRVGGVMTGTPLVLIHHIGARSGIEHVTPLAYSAQGDGLIAIVASNGGSPRHPAWYHNLKANPAITVELGTRRFTATAEEQVGPARAELWSKLIEESPDLAGFAARTIRSIPLFLLRRDTPEGLRVDDRAPLAPGGGLLQLAGDADEEVFAPVGGH